MPGRASPLSRPGYSIRRHFVDQFYLRHGPALAEGSLVLDLGGRKSRKRGRFDIEAYPLKVVYANLSSAHGTDVRADGAWLPFKDGSFDVVVCSEMLEFVPDPLAVLSEMRRVLRPRGAVLICVPFIFRINPEPGDFGRYTAQFWRQNLAGLGFEEIEIEDQGHFGSVLAHLLSDWLANLRAHRLKGRLSKRLAAWAEVLVKRRGLERDAPQTPTNDAYDAWQRSYVTGYGIRAVKPG